MNIAYYALKILMPRAKAFEAAAKDPRKAQKKALFEFLNRNQKTEYGVKYNFSKIKSIEEYQNLVPLTGYDTLKPYIERMTRGESNILTVDKPVLFGITSGSTGRAKFIPVTAYSRSRKTDVLDLWVYYLSRDHPGILDGKILIIVSPEVEGHTESGIPYGAESGHGYKNLPEAIKNLCSLPYRVLEIEDYDSRYYCILRIAIEQNVTDIAAMNPSTIVLLCQKIDKLQQDIIEDIEKGTLNRNLAIPDGIRKMIEKTLRPNPERAYELRQILQEKGELLPRHFWPKLALIECWKGGSVGLYLKEFPKYFGNVPVRDFGYLSSEARCSIPLTDEGAGGALAINANFYEFIPKEDMGKNQKRILLCDQLEKGSEYLVVLTTPGGLYRYNIDDVIRVDGFFNKTPIIEFVQKGHNVTSITGEKLYEFQLVRAVNKATDREGLMVKFFVASIEWQVAPRYVFLVEFNENPSQQKKQEFLKSIEKELCDANAEYQTKRRSQRLNHPILKIVRSGEFERFRIKKVGEGMHDGQFKLPQLTPDLEFQKNFDIEEEISP